MNTDYKIKLIVYKQSIDNEDDKCNWTTPYSSFCLVYNYFSPYSNTMLNSPNAVTVYLYYILSEWNNLPDIILFTLFDKGDHSHFNITTHFSKQIHLTAGFYIELDKKGILPDSVEDNEKFINWWSKYINKQSPISLNIMYSSTNTFSVSKKCIQRHSLDYYQDLYKLVSTDTSYVKYIEWCWYYIFNTPLSAQS